MVQLYVRIVWVPEHEHRHSKGKASFQPSVDYSSLGNGNGKRNRINLKRPRGVSALLIFITALYVEKAQYYVV